MNATGSTRVFDLTDKDAIKITSTNADGSEDTYELFKADGTAYGIPSQIVAERLVDSYKGAVLAGGGYTMTYEFAKEFGQRHSITEMEKALVTLGEFPAEGTDEHIPYLEAQSNQGMAFAALQTAAQEQAYYLARVSGGDMSVYGDLQAAQTEYLTKQYEFTAASTTVEGFRTAKDTLSGDGFDLRVEMRNYYKLKDLYNGYTDEEADANASLIVPDNCTKMPAKYAERQGDIEKDRLLYQVDNQILDTDIATLVVAKQKEIVKSADDAVLLLTTQIGILPLVINGADWKYSTPDKEAAVGELLPIVIGMLTTQMKDSLDAFTNGVNTIMTNYCVELAATRPDMDLLYLNLHTYLENITDPNKPKVYTNIIDELSKKVKEDGVDINSNYLYWDKSHPTTRAYKNIGDAAGELIKNHSIKFGKQGLSTIVDEDLGFSGYTSGIITLVGGTVVTHVADTPYSDQVITSGDGVLIYTLDGVAYDVTQLNNQVSGKPIGTYTVTYTATDGLNTATATRTVNVVD